MASKPALPLLRQLVDPAATSFLREARTFLDRLLGSEHLWGNEVSVTFSGAGTQAVAHGLRRRATGYVVQGLTADIRVFDGVIPASPLPETTHIYLASSGAGTARVRIF